MTLDGDDALIGAAQAHEPYITGETLAVQISYEWQPDGGSEAAGAGEAGEPAEGAGETGAPVLVDGHELRVGVAVA